MSVERLGRGVAIARAESLEFLRSLESNSYHASVSDPPSGIAFMGKAWDDFRGRGRFVAEMTGIFRELRRVLRPGAHALVWALPRTAHWTTWALEDAGFEVRDTLGHVFATGFPKSQSASIALDKRAGVKPIRIERPSLGMANNPQWNALKRRLVMPPPTTPEAKRWAGWGTALKPAREDWILVRKPLAGTLARNLLEYGAGAIHIAGTRVPGTKKVPASPRRAPQGTSLGDSSQDPGTGSGWDPKVGRWPPNLLLSHGEGCLPLACVVGCAVGELGGGVSAFFPVFYAAKASAREKNAGCAGLPIKTPEEMTGRKSGSAGLVMLHPNGQPKANPRAGTSGKGRPNHHPTVKNVALMRWLCRLVAPPGGVVVDPFMGSGSTGVACVVEGFGFLGIEREVDYFAIARARLVHSIALRARLGGE